MASGGRAGKNWVRTELGANGKGPTQHQPPNHWCERGDSNPHGFTRQILSLVRLPIPPLSQTSYPERLLQTEGAIRVHRSHFREVTPSAQSKPSKSCRLFFFSELGTGPGAAAALRQGAYAGLKPTSRGMGRPSIRTAGCIRLQPLAGIGQARERRRFEIVGLENGRKSTSFEIDTLRGEPVRYCTSFSFW
jgi:hypothetical protein